MKIFLLLLTSFLSGAIAAWLLLNSNTNQPEEISRKLLIESSLDALEYIHEKNPESAELVLAATINSQILTERGRESTEVAEWRRRMAPHNERLGLQMGAKSRSR